MHGLGSPWDPLQLVLFRESLGPLTAGCGRSLHAWFRESLGPVTAGFGRLLRGFREPLARGFIDSLGPLFYSLLDGQDRTQYEANRRTCLSKNFVINFFF